MISPRLDNWVWIAGAAAVGGVVVFLPEGIGTTNEVPLCREAVEAKVGFPLTGAEGRSGSFGSERRAEGSGTYRDAFNERRSLTYTCVLRGSANDLHVDRTTVRISPPAS